MTRGRLTGRLWFEIEGSSPSVPYFKRTRWEDVEIDIPKELEPKQPEKWSVVTEDGETFEP